MCLYFCCWEVRKKGEIKRKTLTIFRFHSTVERTGETFRGIFQFVVLCDNVVVSEVLANGGRFYLLRYPVLHELIRRADTRQHQQLRCSVSATRDDDFLACHHSATRKQLDRYSTLRFVKKNTSYWGVAKDFDTVEIVYFSTVLSRRCCLGSGKPALGDIS